MIYIGIDLGRPGALAVLEGERFEKAQVLSAQGWTKKATSGQLQGLFEFALQKYRPTAVAVEQTKAWGFRSVILSQGGQYAILEALCQSYGVPILSLLPSDTKRLICGTIQAGDAAVIRAVNDLLKKSAAHYQPVHDIHLADACAMALLAMNRGGK